MSRWIDQFKSHPFNTQWDRVLDGLGKAKVDDETIVTDVKELARLEKVASYLNVMIRGVDPELVPLSTWDSFHSQAEACAGQIEAYISNRRIGHIQNANNHADNLLTYLRPYMVGETVARDAAQSSLSGYFNTFIGYVESFKDKSSQLLSEIGHDKEAIGAIFKSVNILHDKVDRFDIELFDPSNGTKRKLEQFASAIAESHTKIVEVYNEVVVGSDDKPSTKQSVQQAHAVIELEKEKAMVIVDSIEAAVIDIKRFYIEAFGDKTDQGERLGGIALDLDNLKSELIAFKVEQKTRYEALNEEIEDLLPGATSAGLATAYKDMRDSFSRSILISNVTFYAALLLLFISALSSAVESLAFNPFNIVFAHDGEWDAILKGVAHRLPLYVPVLWLALYASKRRSESQRLQQEYAHKEALAKSYNNFKKQIDDLGQTDMALLKKLIDKAIDAISYNASETLDRKHDEKMPIHQIIESLSDALSKPKAGKPN